MNLPMFTSTGEAPRVVRVEALAFHDATGRIHHMHHHVVLEGAAPRSLADMLDEVKANARALNHDVSRLRVLHIRDPFNFSAVHRVDVKKGVLVELKPPAHSLKATPRKKTVSRKKTAARKSAGRRKTRKR